MSSCPPEFLEVAHTLADIGGEVHRRHFRRPVNIDIKPDGSPVTEVDRETELAVRELLEKRYPSHGIVGEEYPAVRECAEFVWLIDPVDGTEAFLAGIPIFGFLLALMARGKFILGLIEQPIIRDRWIGADGHGTSLNGQYVKTRRCKNLNQAILYTDGPTLNKASGNDAIARVCGACRRFRYGVECYTYGALASGHIDLVIDYGLDVYDFGPLEPVVRNAGGALTDWQGNSLGIDSSGSIVAVGDHHLLGETIARLRTTQF